MAPFQEPESLVSPALEKAKAVDEGTDAGSTVVDSRPLGVERTTGAIVV
jgi:hypothetical protein